MFTIDFTGERMRAEDPGNSQGEALGCVARRYVVVTFTACQKTFSASDSAVQDLE